MIVDISHGVERVDWLFKRCFYRVKKYYSFNSDFLKNTPNSYEEDRKFRKKFEQYLQAIEIEKRYAYSFFIHLLIELNQILKNNLKNIDFPLRKKYSVFIENKPATIQNIKDMILFLRHCVCHPEDKFGNKKNPKYIDNPKKYDNSFSHIGFIENKNEYYFQAGGGILYFQEIEKLIRLMKKETKK